VNARAWHLKITVPSFLCAQNIAVRSHQLKVFTAMLGSFAVKHLKLATKLFSSMILRNHLRRTDKDNCGRYDFATKLVLYGDMF